MITIIRSKALGDYTEADPASNDHRKKLQRPDPQKEPERYLVWFWDRGDEPPSIQRSIALLLSTPRTLKIMLRLVIDAWDVLKGEIDFDDLLVVSTIRAAEPDIFAHIEDNIHRIQSGYQNSNISAQRPSPDYGGDELKKLLEEVSDLRRRAAIRSCIEFVFPRVFEEYDRNMWVERTRENPQGLWDEPYWNRYINLDLPDQELSDQELLGIIKRWREGESGDEHRLLGLMFIPEQEGRIERFRNQFQPQDLCRLLVDALQQLSALPVDAKVEKLEWIRLPGLSRPFQMLADSHISRAELADCLVRIFENHVRQDLWLVERVLRLLYHDDQIAYLLQNHMDVVRSSFAFELRDSFAVDEANTLLCSLLARNPWVLWRCIRYTEAADLETIYKSGNPISVAWGRIREVLLQLAEQDRRVGIPYLAVFVADTKHQPRSSVERMESDHGSPVGYMGMFNEAEARARFDDQYDRLMRLFFDLPNLEGLDRGTWAAVEAVSKAAHDSQRRE